MGVAISKCKNRNARSSSNSQPEVNNSKGDESSEFSEITKTIERAWKQIESQDITNSNQNEKLNKTGWTEIRVFVSSTFSDMHSEREILVKKVFPELRDWCEERECILTECDLRWGIPKDTESNTTISVCMEEIDRCFEENDGKPFFINILSERYGWIPSDKDVSNETKEKYQWIENVSITHMEIIHGAYRTNNPNAIFCLRDPKFICQLPENHLNKFVETEELPKLHLEMLKKKLREKFSKQCESYGCDVSGVDQNTGREKVKLVGLEDFGQKVLNFFKSAISKQYLANGVDINLNENDQEDLMHQRTMSLYLISITGRINELNAIIDYVEKGCVSELFSSEIDDHDPDTEREDFGLNDNKILCISGIPGVGKSSILCKSAQTLSESGKRVLFHYTGCSANSSDWKNVVKRIINLGDCEESEETEMDNEELLLEKMKNVLKKMKEPLTIFICKLENMYNSDSVNCLKWLPARLPEKVRCVVSVDSNHHICMNRLQSKECHFLKLGNFSSEESSLFVQKYLIKYNKKLDGPQMNIFLSKESSTFPLWLKIASEELRIFGDFVTLGDKIKSFPDSLKGLITEIIDRLLREDETSLMEKLLCLMLCSHSGLPESEVCKLLGEPENGTESPPIVWATIRRHLKPFIIQTRFHKTSKIKFMHEAFTNAVKELMINEEKYKMWNKYLADYYEFHNKNEIYLWDDLFHNLFHSGEWKRIAIFYKTDMKTFSMNNMLRSQMLSRIRCTGFIFPNEPCKVVFCHRCSYSSRIISVLPAMTKDLCYVCGSWAPSKDERNLAMLCTKHRTHVSENFKKCFNCNMPASFNPTYMHLCQFCIRGNKCCYLRKYFND